MINLRASAAWKQALTGFFLCFGGPNAAGMSASISFRAGGEPSLKQPL